MMSKTDRSLRFGARLLAPDRAHFRLWAPACASVGLEIDGRAAVSMTGDGKGWFEAEYPCGAGTRYRFHLPDGSTVPDPASRAQAGDVHDDSLVVDEDAYDWKHADWPGRPWHETVIYELHVGAFGGFAGLTDRLAFLAELGITAVELMPIADFPGPRNWGYDGVLPFAPDAAYGTPEDLKRLIDTAHGLGLMMFLDVVYNHFGPEGNYLGAYAAFYRHDRSTPWGDAIDFRRPEVRRFFIESAIHWMTEYRFDGLRLDAVHAIRDNGFLLELATAVRAAVGPTRHAHLIVENEDNTAELLRGDSDRPGFDGQWADGLHHCLHVQLTGEREGYYGAFAENPTALLARCLADGFAFRENSVPGANGSARSPAGGHLPPTAFVICLQNHDQVGNRALGERLGQLAAPDALRAATALLLLVPQIPLLFMGQEWAATAPFLYFTSFTGELAAAVREGRRREFAHFSAFTDPDRRQNIPDPNDVGTFRASVPDIGEIAETKHRDWLDLHRALLALRAAEIMPRIPRARSLGANILGEASVRAGWRMGDGSVLTIAINLGSRPVACPLPAGRTLFDSTAEDGRKGWLSPHSLVAVLEGGSDV